MTAGYTFHIIFRVIYLLTFVGVGIYYVVEYGFQTGLDSDDPAEIIDDSHAVIVMALVLTLLVCSLVPLAISPAALNQNMRAIFCMSYAELIAFPLVTIVIHALTQNADSSNTAYVDSWPAIIFMALITSGIIMIMALMKYRNSNAYAKALDSTKEESQDSIREPLVTNEGEDVSTTNRLLNIIAIVRAVNSVMGIIYFDYFALKFGLTTNDDPSERDLWIYVVPKLVSFLVMSIIIHRVGLWASSTKMKAELIAVILFVANLIVLLGNIEDAHFDGWPTIVTASELFCVIINTGYTLRHQYAEIRVTDSTYTYS